MSSDVLLYILAAVVILVGLAGTILPALPGVPLVYAGMVLAAWVGDFKEIGAIPLIILGLLMVFAVAMDFVAAALGVKKTGASTLAFAGAGIGTVVGIFFGLPGLLLGPLVGAIIGELMAGKQMEQAWRAGVGAAIGFILGALLKIALAFTMLGVFAAALVF
jgi:uncharacterized protein YqgC (DUF456 family)